MSSDYFLYLNTHSGHIYYSTCFYLLPLWFRLSELLHFKSFCATNVQQALYSSKCGSLDGDRFTVQALGNEQIELTVHLDESYYEKITHRKIAPEELVEFAVRYLNEEKANHRPLPENIYIARINYFYPSFEAEVAQHKKDRWKPFVWRKFKFDLFGAIKLGLKCTFWPFALMPIYVRTLRGHAKLKIFLPMLL